MWDPYAEFETATLPNGLTVHAAHWPRRPWEVVGFAIHTGAKHDPVGFEGLAHFVEHVVSLNADVSRRGLGAFFEECGGGVDLGGTSYAGTRFRFFVSLDRPVLARAFSLFGRMLFSAVLEKEFERERKVILEEFHRHYPVEFKLELEMREHRQVYAGWWLERAPRPLGIPESIARITPEALQAHYDAHYTPANLSIVGVGGLRISELVELVSESPLAIRKDGSRMPLPRPETAVAPPSETKYVFEAGGYLKMPIRVGAYRSVAKLPGNLSAQAISIAQDTLNELLGDEVRERRAWTYAIGTNRQNLGNFFEFSINCSALALTALDEIEEVVEGCIVSAVGREDLFEQMRQRALADVRMVDMSAQGVRDETLEDLFQSQRIVSLSEVSENLARLTMRDVRDVIGWLSRDRRWTLLTRP